MSRFRIVSVLSAALLAVTGTAASAATVTVTVENLSPDGGLFATPVWVGFHDGSFDLFDVGAEASEGLERIAEDGTFATIREEFGAATGGTGQGGVITAPGGFAGAPVFEPGETVSQTFEVDELTQRLLSFGAMVLPSNDAFFGTDDAVELFDADGNFLGTQTLVFGADQIFDAGTEANTELDAAFLNQTGPDTGITTAELIGLHPGFIGSLGGPESGPNGEAGSVLGGTVAAGAVIDPVLGDFTRPGFGDYVRVTVTAGDATAIPTPSAAAAGLLGLGAMLARRRRSS